MNVWKVVLTIAVVGIVAGSDSDRYAFRRLAQDSCAVIDGCAANSCSLERRRWRCSTCLPGFVLTRDRSTCACPAGLYRATGGCRPCIKDHYCPWRGKPVRCPGLLVTASTGAHKVSHCVNPPGYQYVDNSRQPYAVPCGSNEYSLGLAKQPSCNSCPPGTATDPANVVGIHTSSSVCKAPPGSYMQRSGEVVPCPLGTFKSGYSGINVECTACADAGRAGFTTSAVGARAARECSYVLEGYTAVVQSVVQLAPVAANIFSGSITAKLCPHDHWCPGGLPTEDGYARPCSPNLSASNALRTRRAGATSADECVAPPGFRYADGAAIECANGYYNDDWDRSATCTPCGSNPATGANAEDPIVGWKSDRLVKIPIRNPHTGFVMTSFLTRGNSSTCYLRRGMGTLTTSDGALTAVACSGQYYGIARERRYGIRPFMCQSCPTNQLTSCPSGDTACATDLVQYGVAYTQDGDNVTAYHDQRACRHPPGYGWITTAWASSSSGNLDQSAVSSGKCPQGYYSSGGTNGKCQSCPFFLLTAAEGATSISDCVAPPGFRFVSSSSSPIDCSDGTYQPAYTTATTCIACGQGGLWGSAKQTRLLRPNADTGIPLTTFVRGSASDCYLGPGLGTTGSGPNGTYTSVVCNTNNYGSSNITWGNGASPCTACPAGTATSCAAVTDGTARAACDLALNAARNSDTGGYTSAAACMYLPGYGTINGVPTLCSVGSYSPGGAPGPCTACPGWVTGASFSQQPGMTQESDCYSCSYGMTISPPTLPGTTSSGCALPSGQAAVSTAPAASSSCPASTTPPNTCLGPVTVALVTGTTACPQGFYCAGGDPNSAGVPQACPVSGVTTAGTGADSGTDCNVIDSGRAPADDSGNVFYTAPSSIGQVASTVPCPAGYYCPGGASVLTPAGLPQQCTKNLSSTAGSDGTEDCNIIPAGQAAIDSNDAVYLTVPPSVAAVKGTTACPANYYCLGGASVLTAAGLPQACGSNMVTEGTGKIAATDCVAPPGYYYDSTSNTAVICPSGTYKSTFDRAIACISCGASTSRLPRDDADDCGVTGVVVQSLGDIYTSNGNIGAWNDRNEAGTFSSASIDQSGKFMVVARASASLSGDLLFSSDAGSTWSVISDTQRRWDAVAINNVGNMIIAVASNNAQIWQGRTTNGGGSWTWSSITDTTGQGPWTAVAISGNGNKVLAAASDSAPSERLWVGTSADGTTYTWTSATSGGSPLVASGSWTSAAVSDDGNTMVAVQTNGHIMVSYDSGVSFSTASGSGYPGDGTYYSVACNRDCTQIVVTKAGLLSALNGQVWLGTYSGSSWTWGQTLGALLGNYRHVASSADGQTLAVASSTVSLLVVTLGSVSVSTNGGADWDGARVNPSLLGLLQGDWTALALSG